MKTIVVAMIALTLSSSAFAMGKPQLPSAPRIYDAKCTAEISKCPMISNTYYSIWAHDQYGNEQLYHHVGTQSRDEIYQWGLVKQHFLANGVCKTMELTEDPSPCP